MIFKNLEVNKFAKITQKPLHTAAYSMHFEI